MLQYLQYSQYAKVINNMYLHIVPIVIHLSDAISNVLEIVKTQNVVEMNVGQYRSVQFDIPILKYRDTLQYNHRCFVYILFFSVFVTTLLYLCRFGIRIGLQYVPKYVFMTIFLVENLFHDLERKVMFNKICKFINQRLRIHSLYSAFF